MARVPYLGKEDLPEAQQHIYDDIARPRRARVLPKAFSALLNSPEAAARVADVGAYLRFQSELPDAIRELAIMAVAGELRCDYEWAHHEPLAGRAGISEAAIAATRSGEAGTALSGNEAMVLRYAQELLRRRAVDDETFKAAEARLGTKGVVDLTLVVGYYTLLALTFSALEVDPD